VLGDDADEVGGRGHRIERRRFADRRDIDDTALGGLGRAMPVAASISAASEAAICRKRFMWVPFVYSIFMELIS